jgi:SAM-dependent methyltransferase
MHYDSIKRPLGKFFNSSPFLRIVFYKLLDLLLLRSWHIRSEIKKLNLHKKAVNVLDAGSGFGQYDYFMSSHGANWNILGVDVKPEQIDDCNRFFKTTNRNERVRFELADLTTFVKKEEYDLILSVDVMEHIEEDEKVFENFFASLKNGGVLMISTPSDQGGSDTHEHDTDEVKGFIEEHVRDGYNIDDIKSKLQRAGFSKIEAKYSYGTPGKISWKLSMKYPILMANKSKWLFLIIPFYYLLTYPLCFVLNYFDLKGTHKTGTGLKVKAVKL